MRKLTSFILRLFLTGLATLLPFVVTVLVVGWIVKLADAYVGPSSYFGALLVRLVVCADSANNPSTRKLACSRNSPSSRSRRDSMAVSRWFVGWSWVIGY